MAHLYCICLVENFLCFRILRIETWVNSSESKYISIGTYTQISIGLAAQLRHGKYGTRMNKAHRNPNPALFYMYITHFWIEWCNREQWSIHNILSFQLLVWIHEPLCEAIFHRDPSFCIFVDVQKYSISHTAPKNSQFALYVIINIIYIRIHIVCIDRGAPHGFCSKRTPTIRQIMMLWSLV